QAFGPFTDRELIKKMKSILEYADLVFARDRYSFEYINGIDGAQNNVYLMPDFTNLIAGRIPDYFKNGNKEIAIIPNSKLIESGALSQSKYLQIFNQLVEFIEKSDSVPFFLIHEGIKDLRLAEAFNLQYGKTIKIITEDDPLLVKGIIGCSKAVITSRFHGLV